MKLTDSVGIRWKFLQSHMSQIMYGFHKVMIMYQYEGLSETEVLICNGGKDF